MAAASERKLPYWLRKPGKRQIFLADRLCMLPYLALHIREQVKFCALKAPHLQILCIFWRCCDVKIIQRRVHCVFVYEICPVFIQVALFLPLFE